MRVIARRTTVRFIESLAGHKDQRAVIATLESWYQEAKQADWGSSADIKASYSQASIVGADRVVFNIKGNSYRLIVAIDYRRKIVFIKWIGTHRQYDEIDVRAVQFEP